MDNMTNMNKENLQDVPEEIADEEGVIVECLIESPDGSGMSRSDVKADTDEMIVKTDLFCSHCGKQIESDVLFCPYCGKERNSTQQVVYCRNCGEKLNTELKYCPKCGAKSTTALVDIGLLENLSKAKGNAKKTKKPLVAVLASVIALVAIVATAINIIPRIFVSQEELLTSGKYVQAYKRASKEEKREVLIENLLAYICNDASKKLKDPSSFYLKEAYYNPNQIVLFVSGTNGFGGRTGSYWYYSFITKTQTWDFMASETDLDDDDIGLSRYDTKDRATEKIYDYIMKGIIKTIIEDEENTINEQVVERINELFKSGELKEVELLEDVQSLYPTDEDPSTT